MSQNAAVSLSFNDEGTGDPVILLHPFPVDGRIWKHQREALRDRFRVITPDLRGFGRSAGLPEAGTMEDHADDVARMIDRLGLDRVSLLGLSMGGYIALAFARKHGHRLARLGLADTLSTADSPETQAGRDETVALVQREGVGVLMNGLIQKLVAEGASEALRREIHDLAVLQTPESVTAALRAMKVRPDSTAVLATVTVPSVVIVGSKDVISPPPAMEAIAKALPDARFVTVPDVGHYAHVEAPQAFNRALLDWLAR